MCIDNTKGLSLLSLALRGFHEPDLFAKNLCNPTERIQRDAVSARFKPRNDRLWHVRLCGHLPLGHLFPFAEHLDLVGKPQTIYFFIEAFPEPRLLHLFLKDLREGDEIEFLHDCKIAKLLSRRQAGMWLFYATEVKTF